MTNKEAYIQLVAQSQLTEIEGITFATRRKLKRNVANLMYLETERQTIAQAEVSTEEKESAWELYLGEECTAQVEKFGEEEFANTTTHHHLIEAILWTTLPRPAAG